MTFVFWHHERQGPLTLQEIWYGTHGLAGSVARLRILFWLADRGHRVRLCGNVIGGTFRGISAIPGPPVVDRSPALLVFNNPPSEDNWCLPRSSTYRSILWAGNTFDFRWLDRAASGELDRIVCVSEFHREQYRIYRGFQRIEVIYSGIDLDLMPAVQPPARGGVVFVSAPRRTKGFDTVLRAWRYVRKEMPEAQLRVCGSARMHDPDAAVGATGVLDAELEQEFADFFHDHPKSTASMGVRLLGVRDVAAVYSELLSSEVAIMNASWKLSPETFCRSAVEAQAAGTPVIGSAFGALPEVVSDGETGVLIRGTDPRDFAEAVVDLLRASGLRDAMGWAAIARIGRFADYGVLVRDWEAVGSRVLEDAPPPRAARPWQDVLRASGYGTVRRALRRAVRG